jgi:DNA-binding transcriptional ArsR family regulator
MSTVPPGRPARALHAVREARQIEVLASGVRQELVDALQTLGPCSIAELGAHLGRANDSVYHHVRLLARAGLVVERGTRRSGARDEALYDVPGRLALDVEPRTARERRTLLRLVSSALRLAERELRAALEGGAAVFRRGPARNAWGARSKGWLTRAELAAVRAHLEAVNALVSDARPRRGARLCSLTFVLTPSLPSPRAAPARPPRSP